MGLDARKTVFGVSDKSETQPVSTATETSLKIEISLVASSLDNDTFQKVNNKGADQPVRMHRLTCAFVRKL